MFKQKKRRSREFRENGRATDVEEARRIRREKRQVIIAEKEAAEKAAQEKREISKRVRAKRRKRALVYLGAIAILCAIFAASVWNVVSVTLQYHNVKNEQADLEEQKARLTKELENVDNLEYVEQEARELLRMTKPGEILYILPDKSEKNADGSAETAGDTGSDDVSADPGDADTDTEGNQNAGQ